MPKKPVEKGTANTAPKKEDTAKHERWRVSPRAQELQFDGTLSGRIATDGSMINSRLVEAMRAGWAAVMPDDDGKILQVVFGPLFILEQ